MGKRGLVSSCRVAELRPFRSPGVAAQKAGFVREGICLTLPVAVVPFSGPFHPFFQLLP